MTDRTRRDHPGPATTPITGILPVLMLAVFTISIGFGIVLPQLPALIERLLGADGTPAQIARATGLLTAIYMLALFLCAPLWGWLSDTWGRRRVLLTGLAGFSATMIASALFETLAAVYVERDGRLHGLPCRAWQEHRHVGKQMRMGRGHLIGQAGVARSDATRPAQISAIYRDAETALVQVGWHQTGCAGQQCIESVGHLISFFGSRDWHAWTARLPGYCPAALDLGQGAGPGTLPR